jgi:prepilin-type N-terminal cleavage/methylation domain-containing protein
MFYPVRVKRRGQGQEGLTLLEVVIAVAILTSLSLAATLVFVPVSRQARVNREVALANSEARKVLEKVHAVPFRNVTRIYPNGREVIVNNLKDGKVTTTYEDPAADPLVLRAVLTWSSPDLGAMQRTYYTVRTE